MPEGQANQYAYDNTKSRGDSTTRADTEKKGNAIMNRQVRHHQFVSGDGKNVNVRIVGDYTDRTLHDWEIVIGNDCHELTEADGYDAFDFLCSHVFMYPSSRHFQALVMQEATCPWTKRSTHRQHGRTKRKKSPSESAITTPSDHSGDFAMEA